MTTAQRTAKESSTFLERREEETSFLRLAALLLESWRVALLVPLAVGVAATAGSFAITPTYTGTSTFVPESRGQPRVPGSLGSLAGLATQFGVTLGSNPAESPRFYATVATSRQILEHLLLTRFDPKSQNGAQDSLTLLEYLRAGGRDRSDSLDRAIRFLRKKLSVTVDNQTNVVTVSLVVRDRSIAAEATNRIVDYLNDFNSQVRRSQAHEQRVFVERQAVDGEQALQGAEDSLRIFYERNRSWQQAPQLVFEEGRLKRKVDMDQEIYLSLERELESARIEEVNDVPVITVIDRATPPVRRSWPIRSLIAIGAVSLSWIGCVLWVLWVDYVNRAREAGAPEYGHLSDALSAARRAIKHPFRRTGESAP